MESPCALETSTPDSTFRGFGFRVYVRLGFRVQGLGFSRVYVGLGPCNGTYTGSVNYSADEASGFGICRSGLSSSCQGFGLGILFDGDTANIENLHNHPHTHTCK